MRLAQENLGEIVLVDVVKGIARGKTLDLDDCRAILNSNYKITGTDDIKAIKDSDIIVITAGLARKPGMTREELLAKNSGIVRDLSLDVKNLASNAILVIVTNPLDLMTCLALKTTGFSWRRVIGMGISLDASRFANLIAQKFNVPINEIDACVIGAHGEKMLPLPRFTTVKGTRLTDYTDVKITQELIEMTIGRGAQIVSFLGSGSAYFAPSAAVASLVKAIAQDQNVPIGACAYLSGQYDIEDVCIGVICRVGREGIKEIVELGLNKEEREALASAASNLKAQYSSIPI